MHQFFQIIDETKSLLRKRSSSIDLEEKDSTIPTTPLALEPESMPPASILGTKHVSNALPIIKDMKVSKNQSPRQQTFTYSKSAIENPGKGVKHVQS